MSMREGRVASAQMWQAVPRLLPSRRGCAAVGREDRSRATSARNALPASDSAPPMAASVAPTGPRSDSTKSDSVPGLSRVVTRAWPISRVEARGPMSREKASAGAMVGAPARSIPRLRAASAARSSSSSSGATWVTASVPSGRSRCRKSAQAPSAAGAGWWRAGSASTITTSYAASLPGSSARKGTISALGKRSRSASSASATSKAILTAPARGATRLMSAVERGNMQPGA
mmetsp:Transcript_27240/g.91679  ORF Transcript_27240/g.91679 Transcript_27240/m.91679 type:complete len:231 (-) Transcript_27240:73-765(-)